MTIRLAMSSSPLWYASDDPERIKALVLELTRGHEPEVAAAASDMAADFGWV